MKVRVKINVANIHLDEVIEGASEDAIVSQLRKLLEKRANFAQRLIYSGQATPTRRWARLETYEKFGAQEPSPRTASQFFAFGERAGYLTRLG